MHAEARKKFVIARAWFEGVHVENGNGDGADRVGGGGLQREGEGGKGKLEEAKRVYERALGELEMRRLEVLRVERDVAVLKGDVSILLSPVITSVVEFKITPNDLKNDVDADESLLA